jgi:hypothetical protein
MFFIASILPTIQQRMPHIAGRGKIKKNNTRDSNVVPHRSTNLAGRCLTSQSGRDAVLSSLYGRSWLLSQSFFAVKLRTDKEATLAVAEDGWT